MSPDALSPPPVAGRNRVADTIGSRRNMGSTMLVVLAGACGALAIWLWTLQGKLQDQLTQAKTRADKAEAEAGKAQERAENLRKKLERHGDESSREDKTSRETKQRLTESKEELVKLRAAHKRSEALTEELQAKLRKADSQIEELSAMAAVKKPAKPEPAPEAPPPPVAEVDPKHELRKAELEAEREARDLERQKLQAEREAVRNDKDRKEMRDFLDKVQTDRDRWRHAALDRELELRVLRRMAEHNRRAYVMTMGALDLAEDELYRIKHGTERPEFTPNRASHVVAAEELVPSPEPELESEPGLASESASASDHAPHAEEAPAIEAAQAVAVSAEASDATTEA